MFNFIYFKSVRTDVLEFILGKGVIFLNGSLSKMSATKTLHVKRNQNKTIQSHRSCSINQLVKVNTVVVLV